MTIVAVYIEPGDSARDENRPQFQLMIGDLLNGTTNATAVLVAHTSRFMRNVEANFVYRKKLERKGIRVISIMQEMDDTPTGKLMEIIFAAFDQYESDMNAYRTMAAMRQNARGGNFNGSKAPYGFAIEKSTNATGKTSRGKLVAHPEEAAIGRLVFSLCIDGKGAKAIAHELNRRAVPYRTRSWSKDDVVRVLDEEAAVGTYRWGKWDTSRNEKRDPSEWIAIDVEPFLEREVFNLAQVVRREREPSRSPGRTASSPLLLAGLVKCGKCGGTYSKETSGKTSTGQHPHAYYNCSRFLRLRKGSCSGKRVRVNVLDRLVVDHLADKLFTTERCRALATDLIDSSGVLRRKVDDRRELLRSQIEQVDRRITRWETSFETGAKDLDVVAPRLRELRTEREKLTVTLNELKPLDAPPEHLLTDATIAQFQETIRDIFVSADTPMTKGYLRFLVERIVVLDDSVEIRGKTANALAFMARAPDLEPEEINHPEAVLAKGGGWLRLQDSNLRPGD